MKHKKNEMYWIMGFVLAVGSVQAFAKPFAVGPYLGQIPPGPIAKVFAPGLICDTRPQTWESWGSFSADGKVFLYQRETSFYLTENTDAGWTMPTRVVLTGSVVWPASISPDGNSIYYSNGNLMRTDRTSDGWTTPYNLGLPLSSSAKEWGFSLTADNSFYFCSSREGGYGWLDLWYAPFVDNTWPRAINISSLNTSHLDAHPGIALDESFMVFHSNRPGSLGTDLYLSLRKSDGSWTPARNLGPGINSEKHQLGPHISPDKKYMFFTRSIGWNLRPACDTGDIYWVELKEYLPESYR
ncbi:MAG: hypothetical protein GY774_31040 [Planctomycetes bacterium]|nr:hypothetical protein [Planctomycetota bacterium]